MRIADLVSGNDPLTDLAERSAALQAVVDRTNSISCVTSHDARVESHAITLGRSENFVANPHQQGASDASSDVNSALGLASPLHQPTRCLLR